MYLSGSRISGNFHDPNVQYISTILLFMGVGSINPDIDVYILCQFLTLKG
jgi:hypothetical protein